MLWVGRKVKGSAQGFAAEYCVVCRDPVVAPIVEQREYQTIYWIPCGRGRPLWLDWACPGCATRYQRHRATYEAFSETTVDWHVLAERTTPGIRAWLADLTDLEEDIITGEARGDDRMTPLRYAIKELEFHAAIRQRTGWSESVTTLVAFGMICAAVTGVMSHALGPAWLTVTGYSVAAAMTVWLFRRMYVSQFRDRATLVGDRLARAIAPFGYSEREVEVAIEEAARNGSGLAKGLKAPNILARVQRVLDG